MKKFTCIDDLIQSRGLHQALADAADVKQDPWKYEQSGRRKTLGLLFMNPSLRTRMSTEKAARLLGMETITLNAGSDSWSLETRDGVIMDGNNTEHIKDAAAVMGRYCDILGIRTFAGLQDRDGDYREEILESFTSYADVPVISLESATRHPLQSFADLITIEEHRPQHRPRVVLTWAPHPKALPQAVANSFTEWMRHADVDLVVTNPEGYDLAPEFINGVEVLHDQHEALKGADFVYAKNWSSYSNYGQVLSSDRSWTVTEEKMSLTNDAKFMHCLPVRRNMIVTDAVIDGPNSIVLDEAANRVVSAQVVLLNILRGMA